MADEMRAKAAQNRDRAAASVRFSKDGATAEEKEAEARLFEARLAEASERREREAARLAGVKEECKDELPDEQPPPQSLAAPVAAPAPAPAVKEEGPDAAGSRSDAEQWAALLLDVARARLGKRKAVQSED
ncbi:unnamed protein product, partial [Prorocentrum cordatum]